MKSICTGLKSFESSNIAICAQRMGSSHNGFQIRSQNLTKKQFSHSKKQIICINSNNFVRVFFTQI
ncbi:unnamed protein product [Moneuplotes crassus]|uniref:Uncharacterized protein n=1 Tax=Euplotes crassus TaxID=5936 RepID=A0AAD1UEP7_EUPCR|nr:unnamed protein product [Moneuplotes crassus]